MACGARLLLSRPFKTNISRNQRRWLVEPIGYHLQQHHPLPNVVQKELSRNYRAH
jgi:hypothetical protein